VRVRDAEPADAAAIARVHVRAWQAAYRGLMPEDFLDALRPEDRESRYTLGSSDPAAPRTILAVRENAVIGFATIGPSRDEDVPGAGELYALYIDPLHWRGGVGRTLLIESRDRLQRAGHQHALLWVLAGNETAARFYRTDGWREDGTTREEDPWGPVVTVARYRRTLA
jgi:GNAT superfamily N-acetyltransferase